MNYRESLAYLEHVREVGAKLELANIQIIIDHFPFNLKKRSFIQVAGTNGKGSTSHFITSILLENGFKTGLFTSPHLQNIRERISVNKEWITEEDFADSISQVRILSERLFRNGDIKSFPTYFEHLFLASLFHFSKMDTDFIVLEVGLGGRLDATSTITPAVSVITNISYDHTKTLGPTIKDIAFEKAGIIKYNTPVVAGVKEKSAAGRVIRKIAKERMAPLHFVYDKDNSTEYTVTSGGYEVRYFSGSELFSFEVLLKGKHQIDNANTAIKVMQILQKRGVNLKKDKIYTGIRSNFVPGRVEVLSMNPEIILDSSHNEASIKALSQYLNEKNKKDMTLVFGVLRDKKYRKMANYLKPFVKNIILTEPESKRALPSESLLPLFKDKNTFIIRNYEEALKKAKLLKKEILITGSFYLSGKMKNLLSGGRI